MDVGDARWTAQGSVHRVEVPDSDGSLYLCGLDVIAPDPPALLDHVGANQVVCLQTDVEIGRRHPAYLDWLAAPDPYGVRRLPTEDYLVAADDEVVDLVDDVGDWIGRGDGVVAHCGAGWGRAGVLAVLVLAAAGLDIDTAATRLRAARPAAGPQSEEQEAQVRRLAKAVRAG